MDAIGQENGFLASLQEKFKPKTGPQKKTDVENPKTEIQAEKISADGKKPKISHCQKCGAEIFWFDYYQKNPHCLRCEPPPADSMVKKIHIVNDLSAERECQHRYTRPRIVCCPRRLPTPGGLLLADLEGREGQLPERFRECVECGEWFADPIVIPKEVRPHGKQDTRKQSGRHTAVAGG